MSSPAERLTESHGPHTGTHLNHAWRSAASHCIKCGFCLPACPTYRETGREASSPRGRLDLMYGVARGHLPLAEAEHELWFCLGCLACESACPSGIRYRDMLEAGRADSAESGYRRGRAPWWKRLLLDGVLTSPVRLRAATWGLYAYQRLGLQRLLRLSGLLRLVPALARLEARTPPVGRPVAWRRLARVETGEAQGDRVVTLLSGCVMDSAFGDVQAATVRVLRANGYDVYVPPAQTCCGAMHQHNGEVEGARALARRNIGAFEVYGDAPVVTNSAGCGAMLKDYAGLLADDPDWASRAQQFTRRVRDVSEFLAGIELKPPPRAVPVRVAYDAPCHLLHAQRVADAPLTLLRQVPGLELVPLAEAEMCCGSAGSYSLTQPAMSAKLLERKMGHVAETGAAVLASGNPGCLLQLRMGVQQHGLRMEVVHPVELLARAYEEKRP